MQRLIILFVMSTACHADDSIRSQFAEMRRLDEQARAKPQVKATPADGNYIVTDPTWCINCAKPQNDYKPGAIKMEPKGWTFLNATFGIRGEADFQVIDRVDSENPQQLVIDLLGEDYVLPCAVHVENGEVTRHWGAECERPLDAWTLGWLATGRDERPREQSTAQTGHYPLRGGWWSVNRNWRHDRSFVLSHMKTAHGGLFDSAWLDSLTQAELESLHSDLHETRVRWDFACKPGQTRKPEQAREKTVTLQASAPASTSSCPHCYDSRRRR